MGRVKAVTLIHYRAYSRKNRQQPLDRDFPSAYRVDAFDMQIHAH